METDCYSSFSLSTGTSVRTGTFVPNRLSRLETSVSPRKGVEMLRNERPLIGLILPIALVGLFLFASTASAQRARREAVAFTPPNLSVVADPQVVTVCEGSGAGGGQR